MHRSRLVCLASMAGTTLAWAWAMPAAFGFGGSDLFVCRIGGASNPSVGFINHGGSGTGIRAFSIDTLACNQGDQPTRWDDDLPEPDNAHPVITQNMFRLRDGVLEQIGQSWVKHVFSPAEADGCTKCIPAGTGDLLGVGCCDAYRALINGSQFDLGPKSEINPVNGDFPFPFCSPADGGMLCPPIANLVDRRLQVHSVDLDTSPSVLYFMEVHFIVPDDATLAAPPTDDNNASYRRITIDQFKNLETWQGPTVEYEPAIRAWKANGLGVGIPDAAVHEEAVDVPADGRFWFAARAFDLGEGQWRYEYAVQNLNSDRAGQAFSVPLPLGLPVNVVNAGFHDVDYHSGEPYVLTDWPPTVQSSAVEWACETYAQNVNANALRWGTMYNFRFTCAAPPKHGLVTLTLYQPSDPATIQALMPVPAEDCNQNNVADVLDIAGGGSADGNGNGVPDECEGFQCPGDIAPPLGDGLVDVNDLLTVVGGWGPCPVPPESCSGDIAPAGGDSQVNVNDLLLVIGAWGPCPVD